MNGPPLRLPTLRLPPLVAVLLAMVSVQGGAALAKGLFPMLGAAGTAGARLLFATLLLAVVFRPRLGMLTRAQWLAIVPYGCALGLMNLTFYLAIARIPLGLAVTLELIGPLAVAIIGSRKVIDVVWAALACVGIALLAAQGGEAIGAQTCAVDTTGALLAATAGVAWGAYILLGSRVSRCFARDGESTAVGMLVAAAIVVPVAVIDGTVVHAMTPSLAAAGLFVGLLSSAIPYTLEMGALRVLPSRTFGILMSLEPGAAALSGFVFLGETLTQRQWWSLVAVSAASAGAAWRGRRRAPVADPVTTRAIAVGLKTRGPS